ncbi:hypothetical protein HZP25_15660 [Elizabethkingia anophelis]|nr:hypothetical protein [Elizabethkingia anophelis]
MNVIIGKKLFLILLLFFIVSCNSSSQEEYYKTFDFPLIKKDRELKEQGDYKAIISLNTEYLSTAKKKNYKEGIALCYINLANLSILDGNSNNALFLMKKAENILRNSDSEFHKALLFDDYASLNKYLSMFDNALHYNAKTLSILKDMSNIEEKDYLLTKSYAKRGDYLFRKGQFDSSSVYFHKYRSLIKDINIECILADFYTERKNLDSAGIYIRRAQDIMNTKTQTELSNYNIFYFWLTAGNYYMKSGHYSEAGDAFTKAQKAYEIIGKVFGSYFIAELYKSQADYYQKIGNSTKENYYTTQYISEKDRVVNSQQGIIGPAIKIFVADIERENEQYNRNMWLFIALLVFVGALIGMYAYRQIRALKLKRRILKFETEELQVQVQYKKQEEVMTLAKKNDSTFLSKFQDTYPEFIIKLQAINPDLETSELAFAALIRLNFTAKEIAEYTFIQHASVQQRKRRLRKRLNIPSDVDLYQFFNEL